MYAQNNAAGQRQADFGKMLQNCENYDKDVRHTGALDLCNEINKSADQLEESLEKKICSAFIRHLEDDSMEVKSNAVKCIQRISPKIREVHLTMIVTKLITEIVGGQLEALDIFSLTVRGVVNDCSESYAPNLIQTLYQHLHRGIEHGSVEVKGECLDICTEVFKRFGLIILRQQNLVNREQLMNTINAQLSSGATASLRKRASYAMGQFAVILNNSQLQKLCQLLMQKIQSQQSKSDTIIQVQCLSIIAKSIGSKLSSQLPQIVPTLLRLSQSLSNDESVDEDNELVETALSTLEAIIRKCPLEVNDFINDFLSVSFRLFEYDPNYVYNDDDDEEMKDDEDDDGGWDNSDFSEGEGVPDDDDDTSWKVRRSAVGIIDAVVKTRPDRVKEIIQRYSDQLIDRVKERVDDVKVEILNAFQGIIKASMEVADSTIEMDLRAQTSVVRQMSMGDDLKQKQAIVVKVLRKPMQSKNIKVKVAAIDTLSQYVLLVGFSFDANFNEMWSDLSQTIDDHHSFQPTVCALGVLRRLFRSKQLSHQGPTRFSDNAAEITAFLKKAIEHEYSKVVFEGLRVASSFVSALRSEATSTVDPKFTACVNTLHLIILDKLGRVNIDTEVKHCCLLTASSLICTSYPLLGNSALDNYYTIFAERMSNELTREAAIKGLTLIAANSLAESGNAPIIPISNPEVFLNAFFDLLKKQQRQLHLNTLECMEALTRRYQDQLAGRAQVIQNEVCTMISDQDLQRANLALKVATNLIQANKSQAVHNAVIAAAINASGSELIQGSVKETIKNFFKIAASSGVLENSTPQMLLNFVNLKSQGAAACLAICIANSAAFKPILNQLWDMVGTQDPNQIIVGALTIGEYGKIVDLSGEARIMPTVQRLFSHPQEDVKNAASICMGNVTIGNPNHFLGQVFGLINQSQEAQKYLFLNTLREIIIADIKCLQSYLMDLQELLMQHTASESSQIRSIVAEILGRLVAEYPEDMYDTVESGLKSNNAISVATSARAVKIAGSRMKNKMTLKLLTESLIQLSNNSDPEVKKNVLEALTSVIHSNWSSMKGDLRPLIGDILAFGLNETQIRKELIEEVDLGPFKHKVDHGLAMRKAAFQLLETLQDRATDSINLSSIVDIIITRGLTDTAEECVVLNLNILAKMSQSSINVVINQLDQIVTTFHTLFQNNLKLISSQQSQERAQNIVRALLRVVYLINASPDSQEFNSPSFGDFFRTQVMQHADSRQIYEKIVSSFKTSAQSTFFH